MGAVGDPADNVAPEISTDRLSVWSLTMVEEDLRI